MLTVMVDRDQREPKQNPAPNQKTTNIRRISTSDLMAGAREIILDHDGKEYRLRITALGKLILTR